jgi:hypothetical protein
MARVHQQVIRGTQQVFSWPRFEQQYVEGVCVACRMRGQMLVKVWRCTPLAQHMVLLDSLFVPGVVLQHSSNTFRAVMQLPLFHFVKRCFHYISWGASVCDSATVAGWPAVRLHRRANCSVRGAL